MFAIALTLLTLLAPQPGGAATVRSVALNGSPAATAAAADRHLALLLAKATRHTRASTGVFVTDLTADRRLWSLRADLRLLPASTEKLYTTAAALSRLGPSARLRTSVLATGRLDPGGALDGNLYLRGGGDPTFGGTRFDRKYYGRGATVERLAAAVAAAGVTSVSGTVIGDEEAFDALRGTPDSDYARSSDVEGQLSALAFDRGLDPENGRFQTNPPAFAAAKLTGALRRRHVRIHTGGRAGTAPSSARLLASVGSPDVSTLIHMTNVPSDNFFAETLLKDISVKAGDGLGSTSGGAAAVEAYLARLGIGASVFDGSGLSRLDRTSAADLARLLRAKQGDFAFTDSLAVVGRTGTVVKRLHRTVAQGNCRAKTGTLHDVSNLAGYCTAADGHLIAFAILMNHTVSWKAQPVQDKIMLAVTRYAG